MAATSIGDRRTSPAELVNSEANGAGSPDRADGSRIRKRSGSNSLNGLSHSVARNRALNDRHNFFGVCPRGQNLAYPNLPKPLDVLFGDDAADYDRDIDTEVF